MIALSTYLMLSAGKLTSDRLDEMYDIVWRSYACDISLLRGMIKNKASLPKGIFIPI